MWLPDPKSLTPSQRLALLLCFPALAFGVSCMPEKNDEGTFMRPIVGARLLMVSVMDPAADAVWDAVGTIISADGVEEIAPETDEEWDAVRNGAITVAEAGNLLMLGSRARDQGDWIVWSQDLVDAGEAAMLAAETRDVQGVFDTGEQIYWACRNCHDQYWENEFIASEDTAFSEKAKRIGVD